MTVPGNFQQPECFFISSLYTFFGEERTTFWFTIIGSRCFSAVLSLRDLEALCIFAVWRTSVQPSNTLLMWQLTSESPNCQIKSIASTQNTFHATYTSLCPVVWALKMPFGGCDQQNLMLYQYHELHAMQWKLRTLEREGNLQKKYVTLKVKPSPTSDTYQCTFHSYFTRCSSVKYVFLLQREFSTCCETARVLNSSLVQQRGFDLQSRQDNGLHSSNSLTHTQHMASGIHAVVCISGCPLSTSLCNNTLLQPVI